MKAPVDDLVARAPAWRALSELYLDTDYRLSVRAVAREIARTDYTSDELHTILLEEIHPALRANLCAPAGVWDGFDQTWLAERILRNQRRPRWMRAHVHCGRRYARHLWRLLAPRVAAARARFAER